MQRMRRQGPTGQRRYDLDVSFPRKMLHANEEIILDIRPHWSFFLGPLVASLASGVFFVVSVAREWNNLIQFAGVACFVGCILWLIIRFARWQSIDMAVTNERVVVRTGMVKKSGIEIPLDRINTVFFRQSILERLIGSGDLSIESGGERGRQDFHNVWRPNRVQHMIYEAREAADSTDRRQSAEAIADAGGTSAVVSIPEQIKQLEELRVRGILTDAEFETKKAELLRRM